MDVRFVRREISGVGSAGLRGSFIGRSEDLASLRHLLLNPVLRWITITGPGGVGKTRLASEIALELADQWRDGALIIPLDMVLSPVDLLPAIARALDLHPGNQPLPELLAAAFRTRECLLVLDNFEQIAVAASDIAALLGNDAPVKVLATSRVPLWPPHEYVFELAPLETGDENGDESGESPAMRLFFDRAPAGWGVASRPAVAELCRRLDGLPLAIELAAARAKIFSPGALLQRLDAYLPVLAGGSADAPARHRTIEACVAWSYDQLSDDARRVFRLLGSTIGGCPAVAIEAIAGEGRDALLPPRIEASLTALLQQSLIRKIPNDEDESRFSMLETIRAFALDRLRQDGELELARAAHARYFLGDVAAGQPQMSGTRQREMLDRIERDYGNLRVATDWLVAQPASTGSELQAVDGLVTYWLVRGPQRDGIELLDRLTARAEVESRERAFLLNLSGTLARQHRDYRHAAWLHDESFALADRLGERPIAAKALHNRGVVASQTGDYPKAIGCFEASQAIFRELDDQAAIALSVYNLGVIAERQGDFASASELLEQSLDLHQRLGDTDRVAMSLYFLGLVASGQGDVDGSLQLHQEAVALWRALDARQTVGHGLFYVGRLLRIRGNAAGAIDIYMESLDLNRAEGDRWHAAKCLLELIVIALDAGETEAAARFHQAVISLHDWTTIPFRQDERRDYDRAMELAAALRAPLSPKPPDIDTIIADAQALQERVRERDAALRRYRSLSDREIEIVQLLIAGQSDRDIGDRLSISHRTVMKHVSHLLEKLDLSSRTAVPGFVARYHLE